MANHIVFIKKNRYKLPLLWLMKKFNVNKQGGSMGKITFNIFILLAVWGFTLAPINIHALIIDPVVLEPSIVEGFKSDVKGRIAPEAVDTLVTQIMQSLAITTPRGMSKEYSADTKIKLRMPIQDLGPHSNLPFVKSSLQL